MLYKEQAISKTINPVDITNAIQQNNQTFNSIADFTQSLANKKYETIKENTYMQVSNAMNNAMFDLYNTYNSEPEQLEMEMQKAKKKITSGIRDNDLLVGVEKQYLQMKDTYLNRALENYNNKIDEETKQSILGNISSLNNTALIFYENMYNNNLSANDIADYNIQREEIQRQLMSKGINGNNLFNESDFKNIDKAFTETKKQGFYNYINKVAQNDLQKLINVKDEWTKNPYDIINKYGLTQDEYNEELKYIDRLANNLMENEKEKLNGGGKTTTKVIQDTSALIDLETRYREFGIKKDSKTGDYKIQNKKLNNVNSVIDFRNYARDLRQQGFIDDKTLKDYIVDTNNTLDNLINKEEVKDTKILGKNNQEYIASKVNDYLVKDDYYINDRVNLFEKVWNEALIEGIDLKGTEKEDREKLRKIIINTVADYYDIDSNSPNVEGTIAEKKRKRQEEANNKLIEDIMLWKENNNNNIFDLDLN